MNEQSVGWFAEQDPDAEPRWTWRPYVQTPSFNLGLQVWFATEEECLRFIRTEVIPSSVEYPD